MAMACVLAVLEWRKAAAVLERVRGMPEVTDAFQALGCFDMVVFIEGDDYAQLALAAAEINGLDGVERTETLVAG